MKTKEINQCESFPGTSPHFPPHLPPPPPQGPFDDLIPSDVSVTEERLEDAAGDDGAGSYGPRSHVIDPQIMAAPAVP